MFVFTHYFNPAITGSVICFIVAAIFRDLIEHNHNFAKKFLEDFSFNILSIYNRLIYLTQKQMPGRMADTLLYLFNDVFGAEKFTSELNKQDLADLSGMSKESAVKVIREFRKVGIINISDHEVLLMNLEALKRISKTG